MNIKKLVAGLAALLVVIAAAVYGVSLYAQREAEKQVEQIFAHLPLGIQGRHGAISYSLFHDRLAVGDVAFDVPDQWLRSLHAAELEIGGINHGFFAALLSRGWGNGGGGWSAGAVAASNVEYELANGVHQAVDHIFVNDPRLDLSGDVPMDQWSLGQWITALSWSSGEAVNFRASMDPLPGGGNFALHTADRSFSTLKGGRLASAIDRDLVWDGTMPQLGKVHVEVGEAHTNDVDFGAWDKLFDPANFHDGQRDPTFYALCGEVGLSKVTMTLEGSNPLSLSLDGVSVAGIKMRQLPFPPGALPQPTPEQSLELMRSISFGAIAVDKLALSSADLPDTALALDHFALKLDDKNHAEIANLSLKTPDASVMLGSMRLDGIALRLPDTLLSTFRVDATPNDTPVPAARPGFFVEHYQLADVAFQQKTVGEISLNDLTLDMTGSIDKPTGAVFEMQRLGLDLGVIGHNPGAEMLGALGYGQVFFEAHGDAAYDIGAKTVESHLALGAAEIGKLGLAYRLGNYELDWDPSDRDAIMSQVMNIALDGVELRYDDASLADRVIDLLASQSNQPPAAMRQSFVTTLEHQKSAHAAEPLVINALDELIDFIVKPSSIRLSAKPPRPVTLGQLSELAGAEPNDIMKALGVTIDRPQETR